MLFNYILLWAWRKPSNICLLSKLQTANKQQTFGSSLNYTTLCFTSKIPSFSLKNGNRKGLSIQQQRQCCCYFQYKYNPKVEEAVNRQIQAEQQAAQDYLSMAVVFLHPCVSRPGAGGYFMNMYKEELGHMQDFVQYQLLRGGNVCIKSLNTPPVITNLTLFEAFRRGLEMEKSVTALLENVVSVAESVKDYQAADFVTSHFLSEQMESVNAMAHHVTKLARMCDEHSIYHYDLKLAKSHPYKYISKTVK